MAAFGDNVDEILKFLNELDIDDLDYISGCFENIYGKFMTDDVWDALGALEDKIKTDNKSNRNKVVYATVLVAFLCSFSERR